MKTLISIMALFALNAAWQAATIAGAAALCGRLLSRGSARAQHLFWEAASIISIAMPVLTVMSARPAPSEAVAGLTGVPPDGWFFLLRRQSHLPIGGLSAWLLAVLVAAPMLYRGIALVRAVLQARRLAAGTLPMRSGAAAIVQAECKSALRIPRVALRLAPGLGSPVTLGVWRPKILLPAGFEEQVALRAALGHEMAHIARFDYARTLVHRVILMPLAFHPATRYLEQRLEQTCEMACDELAVARVLDSRRYARALVAIAASACGHTGVSLAFGAASGSDLQERVERLTGPSSRAKRGTIAASVLVLLGAGMLTSLAAVSVQSPAPPPLPPPGPMSAAREAPPAPVEMPQRKHTGRKHLPPPPPPPPAIPAGKQDAEASPPPPPPPPRPKRAAKQAEDAPPPPPPPPPKGTRSKLL